MRIRKRHKDLLDKVAWPLPTGNRVKFELRTKGNKKKIVKIFQRTPTDEEKQMVEKNIMPKMQGKSAYIGARLLARSGRIW